MDIFNILEIEACGYEKRGMNVFYQNNLFKTRVIVLEAGGMIPRCEMDSFVMFYVVSGEVLVHKNDEQALLKENQLLITEPASLSMQSKQGARLMGIQIKFDQRSTV